MNSVALTPGREPFLIMNFVFKDDPLWQKRFSCLKTLAESRVDVGLTSTASARSRMLLAIHEHGAPIMRIPARPEIQPALAKEQARTEMAEAQVQAISAAMAGDESAMTAALNRSGEAGVAAIRRYIDEGVPPPNSPVTVSGGWVYNRVAKTGVPVEGKGFNKPLYDTGQLYNEFDYDVVSSKS